LHLFPPSSSASWNVVKRNEAWSEALVAHATSKSLGPSIIPATTSHTPKPVIKFTTIAAASCRGTDATSPKGMKPGPEHFVTEAHLAHDCFGPLVIPLGKVAFKA